MSGETPQALAGLRVLEVGDEKSQLTGKLLADMGADVILVEPREGSRCRRVGPFYGDVPDLNRSLYFWTYNTSKRSLTLDLGTPDGRGLFKELATRADVVIETADPGVLPALGLGYDDLAGNGAGPLVYCSITPFGQSGPWRHMKATDLTLMASGGQMGVCGYDLVDDPFNTPIAPGGGNAWHLGANYAFIAVLIALINRGRRGAGEYIDLAVHEAVALCTEGAFPDYVNTGTNRIRQTGRHASLNGSPNVQNLCGDGRYANCFMPRVKLEEFMVLRDWLNEHGLAGDLMEDKYLDPDNLATVMPQLLEAVRALSKKLTSNDIYHGGQQRGLQWTPVRAPSDLLEDEHLHDRGFFVDVEHPELGETFTYVGAPYIFHETPWRIRRRAPLLGEDNVAIYHNEMGLSLERLSALSDLGVI